MLAWLASLVHIRLIGQITKMLQRYVNIYHFLTLLPLLTTFSQAGVAMLVIFMFFQGATFGP